jgi:hypothetical protein
MIVKILKIVQWAISRKPKKITNKKTKTKKKLQIKELKDKKQTLTIS